MLRCNHLQAVEDSVMRIINERLNTFLTGLVILGLLAVVNAPAQTQVKPGFNIFSQEQDVEIGRQSAAEVEGQQSIICGVIINHYDSFDGSVEEGSHGNRKGRATLEETSP